MVVSKPHFIGQKASLPDYSNFIRQKLQPNSIKEEINTSLKTPENFSELLDEAKKNTGENNLENITKVQSEQEKQSEKKAVLSTATPIELHTKPVGIPLYNNNSIELSHRPKGVMAMSIQLDERSLGILSRVSERGDTGISSQMKKARYNSNEIGGLSAQFESGNAGISAIGYDKVGGTSYGKYQIASRVGSFDDFVKYLERKAPDIADTLKAGGEANTGSRYGKMPEIWQDIARTDSERFAKLQEGFIKESHYDPALSALEGSGLNTNSMTLKQVVWSTAVQHGAQGAKEIFEKALNALSAATRNENVATNKKTTEKSFIEKVYDLRAGQFGSSSEEIRQSVHNRLNIEKSMALSK